VLKFERKTLALTRRQALDLLKRRLPRLFLLGCTELASGLKRATRNWFRRSAFRSTKERIPRITSEYFTRSLAVTTRLLRRLSSDWSGRYAFVVQHPLELLLRLKLLRGYSLACRPITLFEDRALALRLEGNHVKLILAFDSEFDAFSTLMPFNVH
jgi:hypothetical protein